jgi:hypothetical protein
MGVVRLEIDTLDNLDETINELSIDIDTKLVLLPFLEKLNSIYHTACYITLKNNQIIDAYLNIGKGILLNVEKDLTEEDDIIIYALSYKKKVLRVNEGDFDMLITQIEKLQKRLNIIQ